MIKGGVEPHENDLEPFNLIRPARKLRPESDDARLAGLSRTTWGGGGWTTRPGLARRR
jgi:hypothetical protein